MLLVSVEVGHVQRQRQQLGECARGRVVDQRDGKTTIADGHPHT
jgi:hypothetical protein